MPEMNPIVAIALQLLQQKQQEEELAQRATESENRLKLDQEQFQQSKAQMGLMEKYRQAQMALDQFKVEDDIKSRYRQEVAAGTRNPQGIRGTPKYQTGNLPTSRDSSGINEEILKRFPVLAQPADYDIQGEDIQAPISPATKQILEGPFGLIEVDDLVSYPESQQRKETEARRGIDIEALKTLITEQAKRPNIELQVKGREDVARIGAEQRKETAAANREVQERIAGSRNATTLEAARLRAKGAKINSDSDLQPVVDSVYLGETKLPAGNNGVAITGSIKGLGGAVPNKVNIDKVPYTTAMLSIGDRIKNDIIPKLAADEISAKVKGGIAKVWPTDLANEFAKIELDATTMAREAGEKGNFSNTDIGRALHALSDPGITQVQALNRLKTLQDKIYNKLNNEYLAGLGDKQRIAILEKRFNLDPSTIPAVNSVGRIIRTKEYPEGAPKYMKDDQGNWAVLNSSKSSGENLVYTRIK